ncbi:hypothetical protein Nepgr_003523 [Nepenthes gracilis]|uniref:Homeobox-leucine zipper protein n=1 Tax=Nepenthes gracilis TaxID=150966 RepID=A0AAD3RZT0_NEPGR|nr:hypothetical protein Nepgr_003523 [Nepenthes gracilis]
MDGGCRVYDGSDQMMTLLQHSHHQLPCPSEALDSLWLPSSSPSLHGSDTTVNFQDAHGRMISPTDVPNPLSRQRHREEIGDEDFDDSFHQPEKKRRLTTEQVQYLERSFEVENRLEPERKAQLATELRLQPRQVAIWFQNRRARFKTKQLEKDYNLLKASYDTLKASYENLLKEKEKLKIEVNVLTNKLKYKEKQTTSQEARSPIDIIRSEPQQAAAVMVSQNVGKASATMAATCKQEDASSKATSSVQIAHISQKGTILPC